MGRLVPFVVAVSTMVAPAVIAAQAQTRPSFAGTWTLDPARSQQAPIAELQGRGRGARNPDGQGRARGDGTGRAGRGNGQGRARGDGPGRARGDGQGRGNGQGRGRGARGRGIPGMPATFEPSVVIGQTGNDVTIAGTTYKLDGTTETLNEGAAAVTAHAKWEGDSLVLEATTTADGRTLTTKEVRTLSADGKEMTVESTATTPRGEVMTTKQVFTKSS